MDVNDMNDTAWEMAFMIVAYQELEARPRNKDAKIEMYTTYVANP